MIDLHCHMLPGIDDGPKNLEQSLAMARFAVEHGIRRSVLTPHIQPGCYDNNKQSIQTVFSSFKLALADESIPLEISMAAEVRVCAELPALITQEKIPFLGRWQGMDVILLEFPHDHLPVGADKLVKWLLDRKILPLIAHPERNQAVMRRPDKIDVFVAMGCLLQLTAGSITGLFGAESQKCALYFLEKAKVTIIATDAHNLHKRQPTMLAAQQYLRRFMDDSRINDLVSNNPAALLS